MWQDGETEVDGLGQCDLMELAESVGAVTELPPPPCCWGGLLAGDLSGCVALPEAPTGHFKHKVCARCTAHGIKVPVERVRALESDTQSFVNVGNQGPWTQPVGGGLFRLVNQTAKCRGARLVIFQRTPPDDGTRWAPLPDAWVAGGYCRLVVSKGTFVPEELTLPTSRVLGSSAVATTAPSHAADGEPPPHEPPPPPPHEPRPKRSKRGSGRLEVLLRLHDQLAAEVGTALAQGRDSQLGSAQREALEALSGALRTSAAALLRSSPSSSSSPVEEEEDEEGGGMADEADLYEPSLGLSFPPSPPLTMSRPSSASAASAAGSSSSSRWSSGLFGCLQDKWVCGLTLCCWPFVLAQLWQRSLSRRRAGRDVCVCLVLPLLALWLFPHVLNVIEIDDGELPSYQRLHDKFIEASAGHQELVRLTRLARWATWPGWLGGPGWSQGVGEEEDGNGLCFPRFGTRCAAMLAQLMTGGVSDPNPHPHPNPNPNPNQVILVLIMLLRTVVRTRDGITGSAFRDCLVAAFCPACGLCQLARHEGLVRGKYGGLLSPTGEKRAEVQALAV